MEHPGIYLAEARMPSEPKTEDEPGDVVSEMFNAKDADIVFSSSDRVIFRIHSVNLNCTTGKMPREGAIIDLPQSSVTLDLLFRFIYPMPQPDLDDIGLTTFLELLNLADAASQYLVYPAIPICNLHLKNQLPKNAALVLEYATRFDYTKLMNAAAPHATPEGISRLLLSASSGFSKTWIRYWSARCQSFSAAFINCPETCFEGHQYPGRSQCPKWTPFMINGLATTGELLSQGKTSLGDITALLTIEDPICCRHAARRWKSATELALMTCTPYATFLLGDDDSESVE